jgi:mono/diheme cytochrome c family protein
MMRLAALLLVAGVALLLLAALAAPAAAPLVPATLPALPMEGEALAGRGRALFAAKGCLSCHRHDGFQEIQEGYLPDAPNLTHYQPDPAFVRSWLRDPRAIRPGTEMPNLELEEAEIEALIAFLATNPAE